MAQVSTGEAHYRRGRELEKEGRLADAIVAFRRAVEDEPNHVNARYDLARTLDRNGRSDEAIDAYSKLLEVVPTFAQAYTELGVLLGERGLWREAAAAHQRAVELQPRDPLAFFNLGVALKEIGRPAAAAQAYEEALRLQPDLWQAYDNLGATLGELGRWDDAVKLLRVAVTRRPRDKAAASSYLNLGIAERAIGARHAALEAVRDAVTLDPELGEAHAMEGVLLGELGEWDQAAASLKKGVERKGAAATASDHFNLALALSRVGRPNEAQAVLMEAIRLNPHDNESLELLRSLANPAGE